MGGCAQRGSNVPKLGRIYLRSALGQICGFRTVSEDATLVTAGAMPINILTASTSGVASMTAPKSHEQIRAASVDEDLAIKMRKKGKWVLIRDRKATERCGLLSRPVPDCDWSCVLPEVSVQPQTRKLIKLLGMLGKKRRARHFWLQKVRQW